MLAQPGQPHSSESRVAVGFRRVSTGYGRCFHRAVGLEKRISFTRHLSSRYARPTNASMTRSSSTWASGPLIKHPVETRFARVIDLREPTQKVQAECLRAHVRTEWFNQ